MHATATATACAQRSMSAELTRGCLLQCCRCPLHPQQSRLLMQECPPPRDAPSHPQQQHRRLQGPLPLNKPNGTWIRPRFVP